MTGHEEWAEQAAGYALDALDPDEMAEFTRHLADCDECRRRVDDHALVAAQLGALAFDDRPAPTWQQLRAGIVGSEDGPADVVPLQRRRRIAVAATAAAAAVAAVVGVTVWQTTGGTQRSPLTSARACADTTGCHVVALRANGGTSASVLVYRDTAAVVSSTMPEPPAGSEWVLWQVPRNGSPTLLTTFDTADGTRASLNAAYEQTTGFAVSKEPAGTTPIAPSVVVASGTAA